MRPLLLTAVFLLGWSAFSIAQQRVIYGTVKDQEKKTAIDNANIYVNGNPAGKTVKGNFRITLTQSLPFELKLTFVGYNAVIKTITKEQFAKKDSLRLELLFRD